jgi:hypothetical protein
LTDISVTIDGAACHADAGHVSFLTATEVLSRLVAAFDRDHADWHAELDRLNTGGGARLERQSDQHTEGDDAESESPSTEWFDGARGDELPAALATALLFAFGVLLFEPFDFRLEPCQGFLGRLELLRHSLDEASREIAHLGQRLMRPATRRLRPGSRTRGLRISRFTRASSSESSRLVGN